MRLLFLLLCLSCSLGVFAQEDMRTYATLPVKDTTDIRALLDYAMVIVEEKRDSSLYYVRLAYREAGKAGFKSGRARAAHLLGTNEMKLGNFGKAKAFYKESIELYQLTGELPGLAQAYTVAGINEGLQNHSAEALRFFLKANRVFKSINDTASIAEMNFKIGLVYGQVFDYTKALEYQFLSLHHARRVGNKRMELGIQSNIGSMYGQKKVYDSALLALRAALVLSAEVRNAPSLAEVYLNMGNVLKETGQYDSSAKYYHLARSIYEQAGFPMGLAGVYTGLAGLKSKKQAPDSALYYVNLALPRVRGLGDYDLLYQNYRVLNRSHFQKGNFREAAILTDTLLNFKDSINDAQRVALVERAKMNDIIEEKELAIRSLKTEYELRTQQRNILLLILVICAIFLLLIAYILYQLRQKNRQLNAQKAELEELNLVKDKLFSVISHDLRGPFARIMGILDLIQGNSLTAEEQNKMASQLRLSTATTLTTLDNLLMWGTSQIRKEPVVSEAVDLKEVAESAVSLYSNMADHKAVRLVNNIDEQCVVSFNRNQLEFIVRNLVANAIKFSHEGGQVILLCRRENARVILSVQDQGVGMSEEVKNSLFSLANKKITKGTAGETGVGLGLTLIMEFLKKNGGSITISSEEGRGSMFNVDLPVASR